MSIKFNDNSVSYKIGIYVRESRDDNEENFETIETQRDLLIEYIKNNKMGEIVKIYIDDNVSGSGFERKGIEELKQDVFNNRINLLIIKDLSRLGRNNAKTLLFLDFLEEHGVRVITFDGRYDSLKDNDTVGIDTWYNERYIKDISRKIRANLRFKIEKGEYIGHAPFGYEKSQLEKNKLVINKEEAQVVRKIYSLYKEGYGYSFIAKYLNAKRYESPSKGLWNPGAVRRILCSRVYAGDTVQGVSEKISFKSKKTRRLPESRWVITEGTHEGIVDREEFLEVQRIREKKIEKEGPHKGVIHIFRGALFCGNCGSLMFARKRQGRPMGYICSNYGKFGKSSCTSHHIREGVLNDIIQGDLDRFFNDQNMIDKILPKIRISVYKEDWDLLLRNLNRQLELKQKQQEVLYEDRLDDKISESLFIRMNLQLENKISSIKKEIENVERRRLESYNTTEIIPHVKNKLNINGLSNEIIKIFVSRIIVFDKGDYYKDTLWGLDLTGGEEESIRKYGTVIVEYNF